MGERVAEGLQSLTVKLSELKPWPGNPRRGNVDAIAESLRRFGQQKPVVVQKSTMQIVAGNHLFHAAKKLGWSEIAAHVTDLDEREAKAFLVADNRTAELGGYDPEELTNLLVELKLDDNLLATGYTEQEIDALLVEAPLPLEEDELPEEDEVETRVQRGEVWELGKHRLMCGDSTKDMGTLLGAAKINLVVSSPPYWNDRDYASFKSYADYSTFIETVVQGLVDHADNPFIVCWNVDTDVSGHQNMPAHQSELFIAAGLQFLEFIAWVKPSATYITSQRNAHITTGGLYYPAMQWEPLLVFRKGAQQPKMLPDAQRYMMQYQTNAWMIPPVQGNNQKKVGHPAMFPEELVARCIYAYAEDDAVIVDPFGGSGTTLIVAEKLKKTAYLMEYQPQYCDIILERWERLTGLEAVRIDG